MQSIRLDGHTFNWVTSESHPAFPDATCVVQVTCSTIPLDVVLKVNELYGPAPEHDVWVGPAFVNTPGLPRPDGVADTGRYFLFPAFKRAKPGGIHGEVVRSVIASLLAGNRLVRCNAKGMYWQPHVQ